MLLVDNGSEFTGKLEQCLGPKAVRAPYVEITGQQLSEHGSFVLSGRRANDPKMNAANSQVIRHAVSSGKPLLGICYGAEMLAITLGGTIRRAQAACRGMQQARMSASEISPEGEFSVYESHSYEIARLGGALEPIGSSGRCHIEAVRVRGGPVFGTQFHPEMSEDGASMIARFAAL